MKNKKIADDLRNEIRNLSKTLKNCTDKELCSEIKLERTQKEKNLYQLSSDDNGKIAATLFSKITNLISLELEGLLEIEKDFITNKIGTFLVGYSLYDYKEEKIGHGIDQAVSDIKFVIKKLILSDKL